MEDIWQGAIVPELRKSIGTVTFIPMWKMQPKHWRVLDWDMLRDKAKNDLVDAAKSDRIAGFLYVNFLQKGSMRNGYLLPIVAAEVPNISEIMDKPPLEKTKDDPNLTPVAVGVDSAVASVAGLVLFYGAAPVVALMLATILDVIDTEREREEAKQYLQIIADGTDDYTELDLALTWALSVLAEKDVEWLQEWADEAEQILGEAEDTGQF